MIAINLLPPSARRSKWPVNRMAFIISSVIFTLLFSVFAYNTYKIWALERQIRDLHQQYELLRPTQEKMQLIITKQRLFEDKNAVLIKIAKEGKSWSAILSHFGIITPPQIWFSELSAGDKNIILIKGNAITYPDLANFITLLEQDELLGEPVLIKAEQDAKYLYTKFEMTVKLKGI